MGQSQCKQSEVRALILKFGTKVFSPFLGDLVCACEELNCCSHFCALEDGHSGNTPHTEEISAEKMLENRMGPS